VTIISLTSSAVLSSEYEGNLILLFEKNHGEFYLLDVGHAFRLNQKGENVRSGITFLFLLPLSLLFNTSCTTLNDSMKLGAITGALTGAAATYVAQSSSGSSDHGGNILVGAGIGLGAGLLTSYLIHQSVVQDRVDTTHETEIQFGDLPPSPFVFPTPARSKGGQR
jgi:hypothetical protein